MRVSRWIKFPLLFAVIMTVPAVLFPDEQTLSGILVKFTIGAVSGFALQAWSDFRARQRSGRNDAEIYNVRQERILTILRGTKSARELCAESMESIDLIDSRTIREENQVIVGRTRSTLESFGTIVEMSVVELSSTLVEIRINTRPVFRTTLVTYGEGCEVADKLVQYLRKNDATITQKLLNEGAEVINNAPRRPIDRIFESSDGVSEKVP